MRDANLANVGFSVRHSSDNARNLLSTGTAVLNHPSLRNANRSVQQNRGAFRRWWRGGGPRYLYCLDTGLY